MVYINEFFCLKPSVPSVPFSDKLSGNFAVMAILPDQSENYTKNAKFMAIFPVIGKIISNDVLPPTSYTSIAHGPPLPFRQVVAAPNLSYFVLFVIPVHHPPF